MDGYERDYDQRHYGWMAYFLEQYQLGKIPLSTLISNLEGLLTALRSPDADWEARFRHEWGVLEIAHSYALPGSAT